TAAWPPGQFVSYVPHRGTGGRRGARARARQRDPRTHGAITMQRPVMDPMMMFGDDDPAVAAAARALNPRGRLWARLRETLSHGLHVGRILCRLLFSKPLGRRRDPDSQQPIGSRLVRGFAYRAMFVPIF